ncbi:phage protein Gp36 family protein [Ruegeria atlantica]|uniref:phage protein Gp36 family protein n=1 Tax=Ruegeria atlantica TaxID=81569 RepID=UPI00147F51E3|nr:phage protein Gp36 family protein [Ruegeria atlantica]
MSYATRQDLETRFESEEIACLAGKDPARLPTALDDAAATIDTALTAEYDLPVPACPILTVIACDLARARLYDEDPPKQVLRAASVARRTLREIGDGSRPLVTVDKAVVPRRAQPGTTVVPPAGPVACALRSGGGS